jgi:hypothetical protein
LLFAAALSALVSALKTSSKRFPGTRCFAESYVFAQLLALALVARRAPLPVYRCIRPTAFAGFFASLSRQ